MKNNKKRSNKGILLLLLLVLGISVGYAFLTTTLKINGTTTVKKASWNIHFNTPTSIDTNLTDAKASQITKAPTLDTTAVADDYDQKVDFSVVLAEPGDYYEFVVPVQNEGSLTAKIENSDVFDITAYEITTVEGSDPSGNEIDNYSDYFTYSVKWDETNGATPATNDTIAGEATRNVKVRVEYKKDITAAQLPKKDVRFEMTLKMKWVQA